MFRIVLDANILTSAVVFGGKPRQVLECAIKGAVELYISRPILEGTAGVLYSDKFKYDRGVVDLITTEIESLSKIVVVQRKIKHMIEDPDDNMILECAVEAEADYIISGDKHLLDVDRYDNIQIVTASEFVDIVR